METTIGVMPRIQISKNTVVTKFNIPWSQYYYDSGIESVSHLFQTRAVDTPARSWEKAIDATNGGHYHVWHKQWS